MKTNDKNLIAKNIKRNLNNVFGNTMKFSVTSKYQGSIPLINIQIKEAHQDYFRTLTEFEQQNLLLRIVDNSLYMDLLGQFKNNQMAALTTEVNTCIKHLGNEFKDEADYEVNFIDNSIAIIN